MVFCLGGGEWYVIVFLLVLVLIGLGSGGGKERRKEGGRLGGGEGGTKGEVEGSRADVVFAVLELSLTVPITNSLAFLFTVLGDWWAEGKVISRGEF